MLNAADIHKLMASGSGLKEFSAVRIVNGEPKLVPLSNWYSMLRLYYANPYSNLNYWDTQKPFEENGLLGKTKRYATLDRSVVVYSDRESNNMFRIGIKLVAFYTFVFYSLILLIAGVKFKGHFLKTKSLK
jgi:hypothetical protein